MAPDGKGQYRRMRSDGEVREFLALIAARIDEMVAKGPRDAADLTYGERYTIGLRAASRWTLGQQPTTPVSGRPIPPDPAALGSELSVAEFVAGKGEPGHDMAAGALAWLQWFTGRAEHLVLMAP